MLTGKLKRPAADVVDPRANGVRFSQGKMIVDLSDGRSIAVPLDFYPTLAKASGAQRRDWELIGQGRGISWDALDLDLSVQALLDGAREGIPKPPSFIKPPRA
jgi:uncharacterized protein DUF2442